MNVMNRDAQHAAIARAARFAATVCPSAEVVLLAGSAARGEATPYSDLDIIALFSALPSGAYREMHRFENHDFELFAHDIQTLTYFCREIEQPSGQPVLATMVVEGTEIVSTNSSLLAHARKICANTLQSGPPALTPEALESRRYALTDLLYSLLATPDEATRIACGSALYNALSDFSLRSASQWSASGKAIPKTLNRFDPALASRFSAAFSALFADSKMQLTEELVEIVLAPYGGLLRAGFRQIAPAGWREPTVIPS